MWLWEGLTGMDLRMVLLKLYSWSTGGTDWIKQPSGISMHLLFQLLVPLRPLPASPGLPKPSTPDPRGCCCCCLKCRWRDGLGSSLPETGNSLVETSELPMLRRTLCAGCAPVDLGISSGWLWTGTVLCSTAEAALEARRVLNLLNFTMFVGLNYTSDCTDWGKKRAV